MARVQDLNKTQIRLRCCCQVSLIGIKCGQNLIHTTLFNQVLQLKVMHNNIKTASNKKKKSNDKTQALKREKCMCLNKLCTL